MAQVMVDSKVMRDKAKILNTDAQKIDTLYSEMLNEVSKINNKMKGSTIESAYQQFKSMQTRFQTIVTDIKSFGTFLNNAADSYDTAENEGTAKAQGQGKI